MLISMGSTVSADYLMTSLLIVMSPGTGALITLSAGLKQGSRSALLAAVGCTLGVVPHMLAAITGLAALLHASPTAFAVVRYAGVCYLLVMAWQTMRESGPLSVSAENLQTNGRKLVLQSIVANILNPKLSLFFLAFLPQSVRPDATSPLQSMLLLSAIFAAMTFAVFALYGLFAAALSQRILASQRIMALIRWSVALAFIAIALRLATASL
ncbi:LysE family translocator [Pantoea coffeiphila]|uniref:LysE family translocator n=1 Tax=Pantoea coffeiphila TaxID=1465635 RepID=UPI001EF90043|nr:LysE family translocator [Pantoea coffeiphila]MBM7343489.1 threonine/homoserine/homoserine lactone efflux protein [Pantoea coffeiphila]